MSLAQDLLNIILTEFNNNSILNKYEIQAYWDARKANATKLMDIAKGHPAGGIFIMYSTTNYQQVGGAASNARQFSRYQNIVVEVYLQDDLETTQIQSLTAADIVDTIRAVMYQPPIKATPVSETPWRLSDTKGLYYTGLNFVGRTIYPGTVTNKFM